MDYRHKPSRGGQDSTRKGGRNWKRFDTAGRGRRRWRLPRVPAAVSRSAKRARSPPAPACQSDVLHRPRQGTPRRWASSGRRLMVGSPLPVTPRSLRTSQAEGGDQHRTNMPGRYAATENRSRTTWPTGSRVHVRVYQVPECISECMLTELPVRMFTLFQSLARDIWRTAWHTDT